MVSIITATVHLRCREMAGRDLLSVEMTLFRTASTSGNTHTHPKDRPSCINPPQPPQHHTQERGDSRLHKTELFGDVSFVTASPGCCMGTYSVTPADQMSTLKPEKVSRPLAISGGWNAGDPWLVRHVSSSANGCNACKETH